MTAYLCSVPRMPPVGFRRAEHYNTCIWHILYFEVFLWVLLDQATFRSSSPQLSCNIVWTLVILWLKSWTVAFRAHRSCFRPSQMSSDASEARFEFHVFALQEKKTHRHWNPVFEQYAVSNLRFFWVWVPVYCSQVSPHAPSALKAISFRVPEHFLKPILTKVTASWNQ